MCFHMPSFGFRNFLWQFILFCLLSESHISYGFHWIDFLLFKIQAIEIPCMETLKMKISFTKYCEIVVRSE